MSATQILFILVAIMTLGAALMVVTQRNLVHSALWMIVSLFGVAVYYVLLNAGFLAVAQVVVYIGAIAILIIFAVMMTRHVIQSGSQVTGNWWLAVLVAVLFFAGMAFMLSNWSGFSQQVSVSVDPTANLQLLGEALVSPDAYVLPFELASVLLVAALIGSIMLAWERRQAP